MNFGEDGFEMDQQMASGQHDMVYQPPEGTNFGPYPPQQQHGPGQIGTKEQAIMWQQNHYMGAESGFISASTTQPSSITGHEDEVDTTCYTGPSSIAGNSIYDLDSAHISEVNSVHSSQADLGISDPQELIVKFINFLQDDDQVVVTEYLTFIDRCIKKASFFDAFIRNHDLVRAIIQRLVSATDTMAALEMSNSNNNNNNGEGEAMQQQQQLNFNQALSQAKITSNILRLMTNHKNPVGDQREGGSHWTACTNILSAGGIPAIARLLACTTDRIMINALVTIHSLLLCLDQDPGMREAAKNAVRESNGVHMMVALLKREDAKLLIILTDCLRILAIKNQPTKMIILQGNGPSLLVNIMKQQNYPNLILMTARLLKILAVCPHNKPAIIDAGGVEALARHLQSNQSKITYHCIWTMRNLSDVATNIKDPAALAFELVKLLRHKEEPIIICAAGIIANLTVFNEVLKSSICDANGIRELLLVVETRGRNADCIEPAMCALRHLTNNHKKAEQAQRNLIYDLQGLPKLCRHLQPGMNRACLKACLGIIRNLALRPPNHQIMRELKVIHTILMLFSIYIKNGMAPNGLQPVDGVRWEEIIEQCVTCLFYFVKDPINRQIIRDRTILLHLKQLLGSNSENIVRLSAGILAEISSDMEGAFLIQAEGLTEPINSLTQSRNEKIASFALTIMYKLTNLKNELERGTFRPPPQLMQQPPGPLNMIPNMQMMPGQHPHNDERFQRGFPQDMGPGFDGMMGNPMQQGSMGGFPLPPQGLPQGQPHDFPQGQPHVQPNMHPQPGSPNGFMDDISGDMGMDFDGLMSPSYDSSFPPGIFGAGI